MLLITIYVFAYIGAPPARLVVEDVLAKPGATVPLRAHVERDIPPFLFWLRSGIEVRFELVNDREAASTPLVGTTDGNGLATVEWKAPDDRSTAVFRVEAVPAERHHLGAQAADGTALLSSALVVGTAKGDDPVVIASIAGTLSQTPVVEYSALPAPRPFAVAVLTELANRGRSIVYLHTGLRLTPAAVRVWLDDHGFPAGPIVVANETPERVEDRALVVREALERALSGRKVIEHGIASQPWAIRAFTFLEIPAVEFGASARRYTAGQRVEAALDWTAARSILLEDRASPSD